MVMAVCQLQKFMLLAVTACGRSYEATISRHCPGTARTSLPGVEWTACSHRTMCVAICATCALSLSSYSIVSRHWPVATGRGIAVASALGASHGLDRNCSTFITRAVVKHKSLNLKLESRDVMLTWYIRWSSVCLCVRLSVTSR